MIAQEMEFEKEVLIDLPGFNRNFDLTPAAFWGFHENVFITWENISDNVHSIYLKQLSPNESEPLLIHQAIGVPNINPTIGYIGDSLFIAWQAKPDEHWQIFGKKIKNDQTGKLLQVTCDTLNNITPSMGYSKLAWAAAGQIKLKHFEHMDTSIQSYGDNYSSPEINNSFFDRYSTNIIIEKGIFPNSVIMELEIRYDFDGEITKMDYNILSDSTGNRNPGYSIENSICYEAFDGGHWKGIQHVHKFNKDTISLKQANINNINEFSYPVVTKKIDQDTPFFTVFDTDSIPNNREIFICPDEYSKNKSYQNISKIDGCDTLPAVTITATVADTPYVNIIWEHHTNQSSVIWRARTPFNPIWGAIKTPNMIAEYFKLSQNYPNPFNAETMIQFSLPHTGHVVLKIYDINGKLLDTPIREIYHRGNHSYKWNAKPYSAGVYFYQLFIDNVAVQTRKMALIK